IRNFKRIKSLKLDVSKQSGDNSFAPWTVFLGENGLGKSSILQAIALALVSPEYVNRLTTSARIVNNKSAKGSVKISLDDLSINTLEFENGKKTITSTYQAVQNYVIAYGSTRLSQQSNLRLEKGTRYFRIRNLFDHTAAIRDAQSWLLKIK